jgi:hypothetical protein
MVKTLSALLSRADEVEARLQQLRARRESIRVARDKIFAQPDPDDDKALAELGKFAAQDQLLVLQTERCDRELEGLGASLLNEATHVRGAVGQRVAAVRAKFLAQLDQSLVSQYPDAADRARAIARLPEPPAAAALSRLICGLEYFHFQREQTEIGHARQVCQMATRALEAIGG